MLTEAVKITTPSSDIPDQLPADVYQVVLTDVTEVEGKKYDTGEPLAQLKFSGEVVEKENLGKKVSFFTTLSWFDGGKSSKPSKLYNLAKAILGVAKVKEMPVCTYDDVNSLIGKQVRVSLDVTEKGWNKVTGFLPVKKDIEYEKKALNEDVNPDEIPFS